MGGHFWLIGMMGSGKTAVGSRLAVRLDRGFVDVDHHVADRMGCSIAQLWGEGGEAAFRDLETAAIDRIADGPAAVIATGGGAILNPVNVARMRATGHVVWLSASVETLEHRVGHGTGRPLLLDGDTGDRLAAILADRVPQYADAADLRVETDGLTANTVTDHIEAWWNES